MNKTLSTHPDHIVDAVLTDLQASVGAGNAERGFHKEGDFLRDDVREWETIIEANAPGEGFTRYVAQSRANLRNYYMTKLALIGTEVSEAVEELRTGRAADEQYYAEGGPFSTEVDSQAASDPSGHEPVRIVLHKPEGVPSEIADIVVRCFDFADEAGFDLGAVLRHKLAYNATRARMHGGKAV